MHATRKAGREEDRKVRSMFVSSCVTEHATFALWNNMRYLRQFLSLVTIKLFANTVEPRNNSLAFKGSPSIKVNILRSQVVVFNVISPLFKGYPEIKVKNLQSQWDQ